MYEGSGSAVRNHDEKTRDMCRSVLPSTSRKSTRERRRTIHKRQRARELAAVTTYRRDPDPDSAYPDLHGKYGRDINEMVWDRRDADKVGPLVRWAMATIAADPALRSATRAEQVAYFAGLLPDTTIGRHAVQHIEMALEWRDLRWPSRAHRVRDEPRPEVVAMESQLRRILEDGLHGALNRELRWITPELGEKPRFCFWPPEPRLLLGGHDVEAFSAEMVGWPQVRAVVSILAKTGRLPVQRDRR